MRFLIYWSQVQRRTEFPICIYLVAILPDSFGNLLVSIAASVVAILRLGSRGRGADAIT